MHRLSYIKKLYILFGFWGGILFVYRWWSSASVFYITPRSFPYHLWIRKREPDIHNLWQIFGENELLIPEMDSPKNIADLGSFVDYAAAYLLWRYPEARLVCVEPNPSNIIMFHKNVVPMSRVTLVEAAIADISKSQIDFFVSPGRGWSGSTTKAPDAAVDRTTVPAISLEDFMTTYGRDGFDLVKAEIEGAESLIMKREDLCRSHIDYLLLETHGDMDRELERLVSAGSFIHCRMSGEKHLLQNRSRVRRI